GLAPDAAALAARRRLGNRTLAAEDARAAWTVGWLEILTGDLRYGLRTMAAHRSFSVLAILSLALGIGANAAIFSFMDAILLRALPVPDPGSLVVLTWHAPRAGESVMEAMSGTTYDDASGVTAPIFPYPAFELFRQHDAVFRTVFAHCAAHPVRRVSLTADGRAEIVAGWSVSGDYFPGLAVPPAAGRLVLPEDDRPGAPPVAVFRHRVAG